MFSYNKETDGFLLFVVVFIVARLGVFLKKAEKISPQVFIAELFIALALAFGSWHLGLMQGMSYSQTVVYGVFGALGHIHIIKFITQQVFKRDL
ncbi:hypothetical protein JC606_17895 [Vibrio sp. IB15]|uniref:hypothetical protein n=1 Tax=Vibrio TaxID=662 RepID=UPI0007BAA617|nr:MULTISPECIES: hypothetical protein [Vibrio]KZX63846.1 hypothetical protein A3712_20705 [Vibrio sp. HI00D65]MBJ2148233.1 hypothetical protein [Vibrio sp. IB15]PMG66722.1 hypothetical protein BCU86_12655 [Vibrio lentus]PMI81718.1 hypothetical protein BCU36_11755 [Vibrio lentus]PMJ00213.1 hypothetical protein BCU32_11950 [Vibrio lentus]